MSDKPPMKMAQSIGPTRIRKPRADRGLVYFELPYSALTHAEAINIAFSMFRCAKDAAQQRRELDLETAGPFVVLSKRTDDSPWARSPIIESKWAAEGCRDRLIFSGMCVAAKVVPLVKLVEEGCDGR